ncbi:DUF982 domain-containing protein [Rhizobium deserti]|uniref:DUF982 domain-containing protein n=1 Tax=Rhizobium deserti TaxID=2547961 RepID=A0A4R5UJX8_9HYPH|nr:DUF982 domain-containing protein [Rhizobium deserti]TDK37104.1 DUF982 domain-containing protein [Rhizobium deserti]
MGADLWDNRVELMIENSDHFRCVSNSREAMECLSTCWPAKSGASFAAARKACLQSLTGKVDHRQAQAAFVRAAQEAGILRG